MVNVEKFAERLNIIMDFYELSAALFAEKIEVQRSSISHILSGRNKPSLDFVLKILKEFPEVELYWLLNGVGDFPKQPNVELKKSVASTLLSDEMFDQSIKEPNLSPVLNLKINNEIERIVIFFKDGSFKNYQAS
jgi:transcriptional regulator with XRE-family HTH domain